MSATPSFTPYIAFPGSPEPIFHTVSTAPNTTVFTVAVHVTSRAHAPISSDGDGRAT